LKAFIILVPVAIALGACRQDHRGAEVELIREVRAMSNKAIAEHDTAAIVRSWTTDYHLVTSRNAEAHGRKENAERIQKEFESKQDVVYTRTPERVSVFTEWNMASEHGTWVGRWKEGEEAIEISGTYFAKWHKVDGQWMIRAEVFVPLKCSGGAFCATSPI